MPSVNFVDNTTVIDSAWLNDVNTHVFNVHPIAIGGTDSTYVGQAKQHLSVPYNYFSEIAIETSANLTAAQWFSKSGQSFFISTAYDDNEITLPSMTSIMLVAEAAEDYEEFEMHYFFHNMLSSDVKFLFPVNEYLNGEQFGGDVPTLILNSGSSIHIWVNEDGWWYEKSTGDSAGILFQVGSSELDHSHHALLTQSQIQYLIQPIPHIGAPTVDITSNVINGHSHTITVGLDSYRGQFTVENITDNEVDNHEALPINGFSTNKNHTWTKAQRGAYVTLTSDYGTISIDLEQSNNFTHDLIENTQLDIPIGVMPGQSGVIEFYQISEYDTYIPSFSSFWQFTNGSSWTTPAIEAGKYGLLSYVVSSDGYKAYCTWMENFEPVVI